MKRATILMAFVLALVCAFTFASINNYGSMQNKLQIAGGPPPGVDPIILAGGPPPGVDPIILAGGPPPGVDPIILA